MPPNPLPIGFPLLAVPDANGQINYPSLESSVRQSIQVILQTRPGEQLMHPDFGAGLQTFLQESNTLVTRRRLHDRITDSLTRWEPRILLDRVEVETVPDQPSHLRIEVWYRLQRTGVAQHLGLTMQLEV